MPLLSNLELEAYVATHLDEMDITYTWMNRYGEVYGGADFRVSVWQFHLDAKGSTKYDGTAFMSKHDLIKDWRINKVSPVWYVINDLTVVSFEEIEAALESDDLDVVTIKPYYDNSTNAYDEGYVFRGLRTLKEWVDEIR